MCMCIYIYIYIHIYKHTTTNHNDDNEHDIMCTMQYDILTQAKHEAWQLDEDLKKTFGANLRHPRSDRSFGKVIPDAFVTV